MPNSVIHNKEIYGLKSIWEIQLESQITSLLYSLNENGSTGLSTIIRLKQAQINNWEPTNILENDIPKYFNSAENLPAEIIKNANDLGIKFKSDLYRDLFIWKRGNMSIKSGLLNDLLYTKSLKSLRNNNIMFINQVINMHTRIIYDWRFIQLI